MEMGVALPLHLARLRYGFRQADIAVDESPYHGSQVVGPRESTLLSQARHQRVRDAACNVVSICAGAEHSVRLLPKPHRGA